MLKKQAQIPIRLTAIRVRQLQLFSLVVEVGSISEAARRLHVTQPAATEMLKELERGFAMTLFSRSAKGITLTPQGERVAARVATALRDLQWAVAEAESSAPDREILRVGFVPTALYGNFSTAIHEFLQHCPSVRLNLRQLNVPDCALALVEGEVDLAVTVNHPLLIETRGPDKIRIKKITDDHMVAFMSLRIDESVRRRTLSPLDLSHLSWILPPSESFLRDVFDEWFFRNGVSPPQDVVETYPMTSSVELLKVMPYCALLPQRLALSDHYPHLQQIPASTFGVNTTIVAACKEWQSERASVSSMMELLAGEQGVVARRRDTG